MTFERANKIFGGFTSIINQGQLVVFSWITRSRKKRFLKMIIQAKECSSFNDELKKIFALPSVDKITLMVSIRKFVYFTKSSTSVFVDFTESDTLP